MYEEAKKWMRNISDGELGSCTRAVTTWDGCWQSRGRYSRNCTFITKNYLTGALLYYGHLSMWGADKISNEGLWGGTFGPDFVGKGQGRAHESGGQLARC